MTVSRRAFFRGLIGVASVAAIGVLPNALALLKPVKELADRQWVNIVRARAWTLLPNADAVAAETFDFDYKIGVAVRVGGRRWGVATMTPAHLTVDNAFLVARELAAALVSRMVT